MKKLNTTFTGGAPLKQKALQFLQEATMETLTALVGYFGLPNVGNFIIFGCEISGANITPGMMYIDGELCPFLGSTGTLTTKIAKILVTENVTFKNATSRPFYQTYNAQVNTVGAALSDFERVPNVQELVNVATNWADIANKPQVVIDPYNAATVPAELTVLQRLELLEKKNAVFTAGGGMVLWNKPLSEIPSGWHEVVDWKGRIPVGVDNRLDLIGNALNPEFQSLPSTTNDVIPGRVNIGTKNIVLDLENIPAHNHQLTAYVGIENQVPAGGSGQNGGNQNISTNSKGGKSDGSTKPFSVLNPIRTVLFIEWTGLP